MDIDGCFSPGIFALRPNNSPSIALDNLASDGPVRRGQVSSQAPLLGEWTRMEISHEEENGKWILSLSVGGKQVARYEPGILDLGCGEFTDVKIYIGNVHWSNVHWYDGPTQPGFIKELVVLDEQ